MAIFMLVIIPPAILCFLAWFTFWKFGEAKRGEAQMGAWMALTIPFDTYSMFYRDGLGFDTQGIVGTEFENGAVAFFNLQAGLKLALWPRRSIAADTGFGKMQHVN